MYNLFSQFSIVNYKGTPLRNIITKVKFADLIKNTGAVFYPYTVVDGERPDNIAANYYEDPRYSWIVYMSNDITDPYYDWPLTTQEFEKHILEKYGDRSTAMDTIIHWKNNWAEDDTVKTAAAFEALPANHKKYFNPVTGYGGAVVSYERAPAHTFLETNLIQEVEVSDATIYQTGDIVRQYNGSTLTGIAQVKTVLDTAVVVNNVQGAISNTAGPLVKKNNQSSTVSLVTLINRPIPADEAVYWTPVDAYTYEEELNDSKRTIRLMDKVYVDQIEKELDELV